MQQINLTNLEINELTQAQYDAAAAAGTLNENALYLVPKTASTTVIEFTLSASAWEGNTQTVKVEGMTADANGICSLAQESINDKSVYTAAVTAALTVAGQGEDYITIKAMDTVPSVDIPLVIIMLEGGE